MTFIGTIKNTIKPIGRAITNTINTTTIDRGIGGLGVSTGTNTTTPTLKNLQDLTIVDKTIQNARLAVEIDPTTFSSIMALTILTNKESTIKGDTDADPAAVAHIQKKCKEWDIEKNKINTTWKGLIDGRCFIEKVQEPSSMGIDRLVHLLYDEHYYNFMEITDPLGKVLGYKQRAKIYTTPDDWESSTFDQLLNRQSTWRDVNFTPDPENGWLPVLMPQLFQGDGNSEGFVFKVLDDVYCLKSIKNLMPNAAKMSANTVTVQVGNKDFPFEPYNENDLVEDKIVKADERMGVIGQNFSEKFKKEVILHDGSMHAEMLGNGQLPELERYISLFKQEIRVSLQTPDSRFESASSNRAVAQEQMSGDVGQTKVLDYIRNQYLNPYYERYVFDHELYLQGMEDSMGMIHISYDEESREDEVDLATVAKTILDIRPDLFDQVAGEYFPRLDLDDTGKAVDNPAGVTNSLGFMDNSNPSLYVERVKKDLVREGLLI